MYAIKKKLKCTPVKRNQRKLVTLNVSIAFVSLGNLLLVLLKETMHAGENFNLQKLIFICNPARIHVNLKTLTPNINKGKEISLGSLINFVICTRIIYRKI